jgi:adenylate cyclase
MKRYWLDWLFYVLAWMSANFMYSFFFLAMVRYLLHQLQLSAVAEQDELARYMISNYQYLESALFGLFFGTAAFILNRLTDRTYLNRFHYGIIILVKTGSYFLAVLLVFILMAVLLIGAGIIPDNYRRAFQGEIPIQFIMVSVLFFVTSAAFINFIALMGRRFGPGNLWGMFIGRYHHPVVEYRLFMFLDLADSTAIAERLGHLEYSRLLQDVFADLNGLLPGSEGDIYQYVGDEAVLTWRDRRSDLAEKPVRLFFDFSRLLRSRASYYVGKYALIPKFKAGIHGGQVSTAEVGEYKRDIAHHGDVVNTASRLRSACKELGKNLLISEGIAMRLHFDASYTLEKVSDMKLRGKSEVMPVYAVELTHPHFVS